jgi:hypothetical protein
MEQAQCYLTFEGVVGTGMFGWHLHRLPGRPSRPSGGAHAPRRGPARPRARAGRPPGAGRALFHDADVELELLLALLLPALEPAAEDLQEGGASSEGGEAGDGPHHTSPCSPGPPVPRRGAAPYSGSDCTITAASRRSVVISRMRLALIGPLLTIKTE